ncbi:MAG: cation:proton antiporter [Pseudonocardiaceae bacterium]
MWGISWGTIRDVCVDCLLAAAVLLVLASSLGVLVMRDVYQKLHFVTPVSLLAPVFVALAVLVRQGYSENTVETWLTLVFLVITGPFLTHATIRAARIRETGDWRTGKDDEA